MTPKKKTPKGQKVKQKRFKEYNGEKSLNCSYYLRSRKQFNFTNAIEIVSDVAKDTTKEINSDAVLTNNKTINEKLIQVDILNNELITKNGEKEISVTNPNLNESKTEIEREQVNVQPLNEIPDKNAVENFNEKSLFLKQISINMDADSFIPNDCSERKSVNDLAQDNLCSKSEKFENLILNAPKIEVADQIKEENILTEVSGKNELGEKESIGEITPAIHKFPLENCDKTCGLPLSIFATVSTPMEAVDVIDSHLPIETKNESQTQEKMMTEIKNDLVADVICKEFVSAIDPPEQLKNINIKYDIDCRESESIIDDSPEQCKKIDAAHVQLKGKKIKLDMLPLSKTKKGNLKLNIIDEKLKDRFSTNSNLSPSKLVSTLDKEACTISSRRSALKANEIFCLSQDASQFGNKLSTDTKKLTFKKESVKGGKVKRLYRRKKVEQPKKQTESKANVRLLTKNKSLEGNIDEKNLTEHLVSLNNGSTYLKTQHNTNKIKTISRNEATQNVKRKRLVASAKKVSGFIKTREKIVVFVAKLKLAKNKPDDNNFIYKLVVFSSLELLKELRQEFQQPRKLDSIEMIECYIAFHQLERLKLLMTEKFAIGKYILSLKFLNFLIQKLLLTKNNSFVLDNEPIKVMLDMRRDGSNYFVTQIISSEKSNQKVSKKNVKIEKKVTATNGLRKDLSNLIPMKPMQLAANIKLKPPSCIIIQKKFMGTKQIGRSLITLQKQNDIPIKLNRELLYPTTIRENVFDGVKLNTSLISKTSDTILSYGKNLEKTSNYKITNNEHHQNALNHHCIYSSIFSNKFITITSKIADTTVFTNSKPAKYENFTNENIFKPPSTDEQKKSNSLKILKNFTILKKTVPENYDNFAKNLYSSCSSNNYVTFTKKIIPVDDKTNTNFYKVDGYNNEAVSHNQSNCNYNFSIENNLNIPEKRYIKKENVLKNDANDFNEVLQKVFIKNEWQFGDMNVPIWQIAVSRNLITEPSQNYHNAFYSNQYKDISEINQNSPLPLLTNTILIYDDEMNKLKEDMTQTYDLKGNLSEAEIYELFETEAVNCFQSTNYAVDDLIF